MRRHALALLLLAAALPASAEVYKWVDEKGRTHFGENVPERYRKSATTLTPGSVNTISGRELKGSAPAATPAPVTETQAPDAPPPAPTDSRGACEAEWARFRASQECFERFRQANGSLRAGATEACEAVTQPARRCD